MGEKGTEQEYQLGVAHDGGKDQGGSSGCGEKRSGSRNILKVDQQYFLMN